MLNRSESSDARRQQLSSLMDGELPADEAGSTCALWRQDSLLRQDWHVYHLIGDVLRSPDLASSPAGDEAFLQSLRLRLANEAVPLAPMSLRPVEPPAQPWVGNGVANRPAAPAAGRRPRHWLVAPLAVAAGFVAVAGVMVVTRVWAPEPAAAVLAAAEPSPAAASAVLVRNAQLDRYLSAHRTLANGAMAGAAVEHRVHIVFEGQ